MRRVAYRSPFLRSWTARRSRRLTRTRMIPNRRAGTPDSQTHSRLGTANPGRRMYGLRLPTTWSASRHPNSRTMSGEHHRVVFGTGADLKYRLCNSEKEARGPAADKIHRGYVSQVAVE